MLSVCFFFSSRRRHTRFDCDWSSDVCSSDLVGRFLRRTHLDELPQLWNVLRGDMRLIGPRPERPEFVPKLEQAIPRYRERLLVLPGVTGLAQVHLPPDTDLASVRRKLAFDLYYIKTIGSVSAVKIFVST